MSILNDKAASFDWAKFRESIRKSTPVNLTEKAKDKKKRIADLENDPQAWKQYYFPKYFKYPSPKFHITASKRLLKNFAKNKHWYEVRHWARGLSKTTTLMFDVLFLIMTGKLKNVILTSSTYDAAENFLSKYQVQLDSNQRLINDYGKQELPGSWSAGDFTTRNGIRMKALGAGNAPRGNGNEEIRPDCIIVDDFDTDEECRNPDIIQKKWDWYEKALFFTVDISEPYLIVWNGNIIAEDCCVVRAGKAADYTEIINIRDSNNKSVWPEKNPEADIDYQIAKTSYAASQQEMFNNPVREGQTFKEITWGKCPPLKQLPFVISYADPATSNKSKPTGSSKVQNSCKVDALVGYYKGKYYLYKCYNDNTTNSEFIEWMYFMRNYVNGETPLYTYIENNSLQDPFYEQVLKPLIFSKKDKFGTALNIWPDTQRKQEKWFRIEANLEPLFREGTFVFNIDEKEDPHMKRMAAQFLTASIRSKTLDGPDACEGGYSIIKSKLTEMNPDNISVGARKTHSKDIKMFITAAELNTHLYGEVTDEIDRGEVEIAHEAINSAIEEAAGYLSAYDRTATFAAIGAARNASLLTFTKDIAVWHFIQLANPGIDLALRQDRYEKAIKWLDKVQSGKVVPNLPYPSPDVDTTGNTIIAESYLKWGSNTKKAKQLLNGFLKTI